MIGATEYPILILVATLVLGSDLKSLEAELASLEAQRSDLQQKMATTERRMADLRKQIVIEKLKITPFLVSKASMSGTLYETRDVFNGPKLLTYDRGEPIKVFKYEPEDRVYQIAIKDSIGYGMTITLEETPEMLAMKEHTVKQKERTESFRKAEQHGEQAARQAASEKKEADSNAARKKQGHERLIQKYGQETGSLLADRKIFLGMTREMAIESWGRPEKINRTVNANLIHEQWVYDGQYLYFQNGILTSFQD